jgi:hypothetical protein
VLVRHATSHVATNHHPTVCDHCWYHHCQVSHFRFYATRNKIILINLMPLFSTTKLLFSLFDCFSVESRTAQQTLKLHRLRNFQLRHKYDCLKMNCRRRKNSKILILILFLHNNDSNVVQLDQFLNLNRDRIWCINIWM